MNHSQNNKSLDFLLSVFNKLREENPYLVFELGFTRTTDWMVHIADNTRREMKTFVLEQHADLYKACAAAISSMNDVLSLTSQKPDTTQALPMRTGAFWDAIE